MALIMAAGRGHKDTVELLLDRGADPEAKTTVKSQRSLSLRLSRNTRDITLIACGVHGVRWLRAVASNDRRPKCLPWQVTRCRLLSPPDSAV